MELTPDQQIFEQIKKSRKILIVLPQNLTADSLASGLALRLFLNKLEKDVSIISGGGLPENLRFLPGSAFVQNQLTAGKSMVITVDTSQKKLEELSYQTAPEKISIYLKSQGPEFVPADLSFATEKFPVDLIITLEARSLEDLGELYEQHTDLFYETPKINIDNKSSNEYFGAINLVDITATSVSEILTELLQKYEQQLLDEDIATCLLAGIITNTHSFQHIHTTPKAFLKASELVALGGRQQEIIKNIYKTKTLSLLKLWGRALARMKILEAEGVIYSVINPNDFEKASADADDLVSVLKEFIDNLGGYKVMALLAEPAKGSARVLAAVHEQVSIEQFLLALGGNAKVADLAVGNYRIVEQSFSGVSLEEIERRFLEGLKIF